MLRNHGMQPKYYHSILGGNFRFDTLQAAVVNVKFPHLDAWSAGRQANAARYRRLFDEAGLIQSGDVQLPVEAPQRRHIFNQFVLRVRRRDELLQFLKENDVGSEIYYPVPLHLQQCFSYCGYREGDFPVSEAAAKETLALPIYPELSDEQAEWVVELTRRFYAG
jgi:dTDP-4-amino-4,6-dideoxygalactose transaminase